MKRGKRVFKISEEAEVKRLLNMLEGLWFLH